MGNGAKVLFHGMTRWADIFPAPFAECNRTIMTFHWDRTSGLASHFPIPIVSQIVWSSCEPDIYTCLSRHHGASPNVPVPSWDEMGPDFHELGWYGTGPGVGTKLLCRARTWDPSF